MSNQRFARSLLLAIATVAAIFVLIGGYVVWFFLSRPAWLLTANNTADGARLVLNTEQELEPIFEVDLIGASLTQPIEQQKREEITSPDLRTLFHDETLRPGDWKFVIGGVEVEVWPAGIQINGQLVGRPGDTIVYDVETKAVAE